MNQPMLVHVKSVAFWSEACPDWQALQSMCRGETAAAPDGSSALPPTSLLNAAERRRAPDSVLLALHVAAEAVKAAGVDASQLASVFASPHGDLGITHDMCSTLADDPSALSPTRFIHSVHNAVSGHWGMVSRCVLPSTAIAAHRQTFALALLEAATQIVCTGEPVLLVAYEAGAKGATAQLTGCVGRVALAMVLAPYEPNDDRADLALALHVAPMDASFQPALSAAMAPLRGNDLVDGLLWLQHTARLRMGDACVLALPLAAVLDGRSGPAPSAAQAPSALHIETRGLRDA